MPVASMLLLELELRGGFSGRVLTVSGAMSPTSRSLPWSRWLELGRRGDLAREVRPPRDRQRRGPEIAVAANRLTAEPRSKNTGGTLRNSDGKDGKDMLKMIAPGFLGFQLPLPEGLPDVDTARARMIRQVAQAPAHPAVSSLDPVEREALFFSLSLTLARADYHRQRFLQIGKLLEQRRVQTGGVASFDTLSKYALFEASACLGAVRVGIDEIIFITARLRAVTSNDIRQGWTAHRVVTTPFTTSPEFDVPEIRALRCRQSWYEEMNAYRNVLFHRGWRFPSGAYFPVGSTQAEALDPKFNAMVVPDRTSLLRETRPHQWTYADGERVEDIVDRAVRGLEELLDDVCTRTWGGLEPPEGTMPKEERPNTFVSVMRPALLSVGGQVVLPIFTSETCARTLDVFALSPGVELVSLTSTTLVVGTPAFIFSMLGAADDPDLAGLTGDLVIALDPIEFGRLSMTARAETRLLWAEVLATNEPIVLPAEWVGAEQIFVWRPR
jgi:hypothetical protein